MFTCSQVNATLCCLKITGMWWSECLLDSEFIPPGLPRNNWTPMKLETATCNACGAISGSMVWLALVILPEVWTGRRSNAIVSLLSPKLRRSVVLPIQSNCGIMAWRPGQAEGKLSSFDCLDWWIDRRSKWRCHCPTTKDVGKIPPLWQALEQKSHVWSRDHGKNAAPRAPPAAWGLP